MKMDESSEQLKQLGESSEELAKIIKDLKTVFDTDKKILEVITKINKARLDEGKGLKETAQKLLALREAASDLQDQLDNSSTEDEKRKRKEELLAKQKELKDAERELIAETAGKKSVELMTTVTAGLANSMLKATSSALSGSDALKISSDFMEAGFDTANAGAQVVAGGITDMGKTMVASGKKGGVAIAALGAGLSFLSDKVNALAKQGIGFMMTQTKDLMNEFHSLSNVGAIFSNGMQGLIDTSLSAGMTLDQFSRVVSANKDNFAKTGLGVAEGSKKMAAAMAAGGERARNSMFALGMSMDDQANATAEVMALMSGPAGKLKASNAQVAAETETYAANLKILSDLTGQDMKAKQEQIRQENDTLAFQQKLDGMDEKHRLAIQQSMLAMSDTQRKALRENMIYGTVISKDVAIAQATNSALEKTNTSFAKMAADGTMNIDEVLRVQSENSDEMHRAAMNNKGIAMAGAAGAEDAAKAAADQLQTDHLMRKFQSARTQAEKDKIRKEMEAGKAGTSMGANLMATQRDFSVAMQQIAATNLPAFSKALTQTIDDIGGAVKELAGITVKTSTGIASFFSEHAKSLIIGASTVVGGIAGGIASGGLAAVPGALEGASLGSGLASMLGFAKGGITTGSDDGHAEMLHGTELIVPLKGNKLDAASDGYEALLGLIGAKSVSNASNSLISTTPTSATATTSAASAAASPTKLNQQLLSEVKQMNDSLTKQEKGNNELQNLVKRLLETNERHLIVADNAAKNAA